MAWDANVLTKMDGIFHQAYLQGRCTLHEHEVYRLLQLAGMDVPCHAFVQDAKEVTDLLLSRFPGKDLMIKIVAHRRA